MMKKLKDICTLEKGKQIDTKLLNDSNQYRYINGGIKESGFFNDYNTEGETVLISEGGASCGYVNYVNEKFWCGCHCYRLTNISIYPKYLFYSLKGSQTGIMELRTGAAMPNIKKETLKDFEITVCDSLPEQQKIAAHLDSIQSAIDNKKQQLSEMDELVKSKFVEMFGDVDEKVCVKELCDVSGGYSFKSGDISENSGIRILQIGNVALNDVSWEVTNYLPIDFAKKYEPFLMKKDDIVMALTRPIIQSLGNVKTCLVKSTDLPCLLNQRVGKIRAKFGTNIRFVYYCFMQHSFTDYVQSCCKGSSQPNMSTKDIENYEIPKVDEKLQNSFAEYVQKIDSAKSIVKTQLNDLNELLESKMDFYFGD